MESRTITKTMEGRAVTNDFFPAEVFPPGEFLRDELEARGWNQTEFAEILGREPRVVNEIILAKRANHSRDCA